MWPGGDYDRGNDRDPHDREPGDGSGALELWDHDRPCVFDQPHQYESNGGRCHPGKDEISGDVPPGMASQNGGKDDPENKKGAQTVRPSEPLLSP